MVARRLSLEAFSTSSRFATVGTFCGQTQRLNSAAKCLLGILVVSVILPHAHFHPSLPSSSFLPSLPGACALKKVLASYSKPPAVAWNWTVISVTRWSSALPSVSSEPVNFLHISYDWRTWAVRAFQIPALPWRCQHSAKVAGTSSTYRHRQQEGLPLFVPSGYLLPPSPAWGIRITVCRADLVGSLGCPATAERPLCPIPTCFLASGVSVFVFFSQCIGSVCVCEIHTNHLLSDWTLLMRLSVAPLHACRRGFPAFVCAVMVSLPQTAPGVPAAGIDPAGAELQQIGNVAGIFSWLGSDEP